MLGRTWLYLGLIVGLALFVGRARADADTEARKAFEQGVAASNEGRWQDARREFERSLELVTKPSTLFNLAVADSKLGLIQEAIDALDAFEQLANPKQHAAMIERAHTLRAEAERSREAARPAQERARGLIEPADLTGPARESYMHARDAYGRGDDEVALEAFVRAQRESGRNELLFHIGVVADRLRQDERAVDAFQRFIDLFPELPAAQEARRHLARLEQLVAEKNRPVPATTITQRRDESTPASPRPPPELGPPRALLIAGAILAAGAIGSASWWIERSGAREQRCLDNASLCRNFADVQREQRAAMGLTISLSLGSIALLTGGGVWLHKRKQDGVAISGVSLNAMRAGALIGARCSF